MEISVTDAKSTLTELIRKAEQGEEVILTRHGKPVARIERVVPSLSYEERKSRLDAIIESARAKATSPGPSAARSQDFLYDEFGLPK